VHKPQHHDKVADHGGATYLYLHTKFHSNWTNFAVRRTDGRIDSDRLTRPFELKIGTPVTHA